jgi:hypothetical protein
MTAVLCMLAIPAGLSLWVLISPRSAWHATSAWQHRNPEVHEPSDAAYSAQRVFSVLALILCFVIYVVVVQASDRSTPDVQQREYQQCLDRYQGRYSALSPEDWCDHLSPTP